MVSIIESVKAEATYEVDELVVTLRDSQLPTLLVENHSDVHIYARWVSLRLFDSYNVDVRAVGGKRKLLQIYDKRGDFSHVPVVFIANRGMWSFTGIPEKYKDIIWTTGYSIENDLYSDAKLESLLNESETMEHQQILDSISTWFAFAVEEYLAGNSPELDLHCDEIVPPGKTELDTDFCLRQGFQMPDPDRVQRIRSSYKLLLRGKQLFQLIVRLLSNPTTGFQKATLNDYTLYNFALRMPKSHPLLDRLMEEVKRKIAVQRTTS